MTQTPIPAIALTNARTPGLSGPVPAGARPQTVKGGLMSQKLPIGPIRPKIRGRQRPVGAILKAERYLGTPLTGAQVLVR